MKAVVLVGGEGTRLRPLTETVKKELLPLVDRPILDHTLDRLVLHGVDEVVMSSPYLEDTFRPFIDARHGEPAITWVTEREALDTGGAIVNALDALGGAESFVALNGDILTDLDLTAMLAWHRDHGATATIALARVEDARPFGLVATEADGRVLEFREKPAELVPGDINAGTYVLEPTALDGWDPGVRSSIERDIFPRLIADGRPVYGFVSDAYWLDLGTPDKYLKAHADLIDGRVGGHPVYAGPFVQTDGVDPGAEVGRHVALGPGVAVAAGADVRDSVLLEDASVGASAVVHGSILGPRSSVGEGARVVDSVLGADATVAPGVELEDARVGTGEETEATPSG